MKLFAALELATLVLDSDPHQDVLANELSGERVVKRRSSVVKVRRVLHS
ncbi:MULTISPECIES: hypothetical protein [Rubrivivax]|uniref:Uncharacterized protein n=1 Tax=Rubrivivax benzoatilyticus TaxID=316997 RepID=A0ABX0HSS5_9BURK|nr:MULTISPECIES: hypothetical protein [Rubrivivax]MCC9598880.1 hypothetical protein [Rubrivivax sp. JA1055]MCC9648580.1 hypothetical protein [Rubrivivax sp. JA1029]NHK98106.1 hypothetical protein [Rubrivivax benzoatilyticus]NHL23608.1 hypothetical protein [Rubrivivax benzoatilyticus]